MICHTPLPLAQEHILAQEDGKTRLLRSVTELSQAFALAVPHEAALEIRDDVGFLQAVRAVLAPAWSSAVPESLSRVGRLGTCLGQPIMPGAAPCGADKRRSGAMGASAPAFRGLRSSARGGADRFGLDQPEQVDCVFEMRVEEPPRHI